MHRLKLLLINPPIEDFSAYDHYCAPLGLYNIASYLSPVADIHFIDTLIRKSDSLSHSDGTGVFASMPITAPACLEDIPRKFRRYGMSDAEFESRLNDLPFSPDYILITSAMTYWYSGIEHCLKLIHKTLAHIPVILGGIYASLLPAHAAGLKGVDHVITGQNRKTVMQQLSRIFDRDINAQDYRRPDYSLHKSAYYYPLMSSRGCVFDCHYCASPALSDFEQFPADVLAKMVLDLHEQTGVERFAFYDDALLVNAESHINVFLEHIISSGKRLRFYTPNGLHIRFLNAETARLMKQGGFEEVRFSLESSDNDFMKKKGFKTSREEFVELIGYLRQAGFSTSQIRTYTLANVPEQDPDSIKETMMWTWEQGAVPFLAFYSPIPGTPDFERSRSITDVDEPLFQNNTVYLYRSGFDLEYYQELRSLQNSFRRQAGSTIKTVL